VKEGRGSFGFNAATEKYEDLVSAGVIDPTKVVRAALRTRPEWRPLLLTCGRLIAAKPEERAPTPTAAGMPDMDGMGM
jgi:chaperonin GroEL